MNQPMTALQHANDIRIARADLKRAIRAGEITVEEALETDTGIKAWDLLRAARRVGTDRAHRICAAAGVDPNKSIGASSPRSDPLTALESLRLRAEVRRLSL